MKVSIVIPTYNRLELFKKALNSALMQKYDNFEIIISDDSTNDEVKNYCIELTKAYKNIFYFKNTKHKKGPCGNKNNGIDLSTGEAVVILDDDDEFLYDNVICDMVYCLKEGYGSVWANCYKEIDGIKTSKFSGHGLNSSGDIDKDLYYNGKIVGEFLVMFKKEALKGKRFDEDLFGGEGLLWINLFDEKAYYLNKAVRLYRINREDSVTLNSIKYPEKIFKQYEKNLIIIMQKTKNIDKKHISFLYKMMALYAKLSSKNLLAFKFILLSLKNAITKSNLILFCFLFFPKKIIEKIIKLKAKRN
ncbi:glycosyltransferase family 2 protein [Campylobacter ureolyticus]|uniref:glycosyltransferase family 2 protein n=1 Tax=Campylobacter ureolyticus TaxID=827 RepID=UPI0022B31768|nr:glycosyltransferase family 2 protein [Campylobacter ureolyticus]MCZ6133070.1 glycosyltransferase family 2 protein [Campylobacter ureolyticus]